MAYVVGIDLGTTYSAAAVFEDGRAEIIQLGNRQATIPSMVLLRDDGEVLVGEAAERRALAEPERLAREFKRRLGDPVPLILGGTPYGSEALIAHLLRWIVAAISQQKGGPPDLIAITHPANYGPYKLDLLQQAVRQAEVDPVIFLAEPEAAAVYYAERDRIPVGTAVAVYDFGGGTFDAAVVRHTDHGWELLGEAEGLERLGGMDFDEAVLAHVSRSLDGKLQELSADTPAAITAMARLRSECTQAKESLSEDTAATIPILLPNVQTDVRLTRAEFEELIRPRVRETVSSLERAVRSSGLEMEEIDRVLLVGGSSRIPLVAETVQEVTGRPVAVDAQPKHAIALGAVQMAQRELLTRAASVPASAASEGPIATQPGSAGGSPPPQQAIPSLGAASSGAGRKIPVGALAAVPVALIAVAALAFATLTGGGDDNAGSPSAPTAPAAAVATEVATEPAATVTQAPGAVTAPPVVPEQTTAITEISLEGGRYYADFTVTGFQADINDVHVHFFFDTVAPEEAGIPGLGPWIIYDSPSPFTGYAVGERPVEAKQMCILVANPDHSVRASTGNCSNLPD